MKEQVAEIVAAYLRKNVVPVRDVPTVITQVYESLAALGQPPIDPPEAARPKPAVPIRRSVADEFVTCLECGARGVTLQRHLNIALSRARRISPPLEPAGEPPVGCAELRGSPVGARPGSWPWTERRHEGAWSRSVGEGNSRSHGRRTHPEMLAIP